MGSTETFTQTGAAALVAQPEDEIAGAKAAYGAILVAVDGSPAADRAAERAGRLAGRMQCPLHVVHVRTHSHFPETVRRMMELERLEGTRDDVLDHVARRVVRVAAERARRAAAPAELPTVTSHVLHGEPAAAIRAAAVAQAVDLIVIGSCPDRWRLRSRRIVRRLVRRTPQDVLIVR